MPITIFKLASKLVAILLTILALAVSTEAMGLDFPLSMAIATDEVSQPASVNESSPDDGEIPSNTSMTEPRLFKYVTDQFTITLRSGQSNRHKILRSLSSGTRLGLLEAAGEYSRVRTDGGIEGWVLSRYLVDSPIARQQIKQTEERLQALEKDKQQLRQEVEKLQRLTQSHLATKNDLIEKNAGLNIELTRIRDVAAEPLRLSAEISRIGKINATLTQQNGMMNGELDKLRKAADKEWFMLGAGTIILGMILGLLAPKLRGRRKSDWEKL